jgi:anaerobic selenocysteine-containing dehydrogenase
VLALTRLLIDGGHVDEPFLVTYTNAPQLVGADGKVLRDADGEPLVWDTVSSAPKRFVDGVVPALRGSYSVDGQPVRTAFDVYADSLKDMTPEVAAEIAGVPAETLRDLAMQIARAARIGTTTRIGDFTHRYRPVSIHTWRGMTAKEFGVQTWRAGLMLQMILGIPDAIGGNKLGKVFSKPDYMAPSKCEYPPSGSILPRASTFRMATTMSANRWLSPCSSPRPTACHTRPKCRFSTPLTDQYRPRTRVRNFGDWRRHSTSRSKST